MGHSIGQVAALPMDKLRKLVARPLSVEGLNSEATKHGATPGVFLDQCMAAIRSLDGPALDDALRRAGVTLGTWAVLQQVVAPLAQNLGELWRGGSLTSAHEHFATAAIRLFLGQAGKPFGAMSMEEAPVLVVATPAGQVHEIGALLAGATAANLGWQVVYLGASLPAAEIAGAALQRRAGAVALSLVYPEDDPRLEGELKLLRKSLPQETRLLAGGRAMPAYWEVLKRLGVVPVESLAELGSILDEMRKGKSGMGRKGLNRT